MREAFARAVLQGLLASGRISRSDRVLVVCAGYADARLLRSLGFTRGKCVTLDLNSVEREGDTSSPFVWCQADAHSLPFDDGEFAFSWVADGLHHCHSPHRVVTEMARVSRNGLLVMESRDSVLVRIACRLGLAAEYEANGRLLSTRSMGGVDFGSVPNFIYRWTEYEFEKVLSCFDPARRWDYEYYYEFNVPRRLPTPTRAFAEIVGRVATQLMPRQANTFAMAAFRGGVKRYLEGVPSGGYRLRQALVSRADVDRAVRAEKSQRIGRRVRSGSKGEDDGEYS